MYVTAKYKQDDISALLSALTLKLNSFYFGVFNCFLSKSKTIFQPIPICDKTVFQPDLCSMMSQGLKVKRLAR